MTTTTVTATAEGALRSAPGTVRLMNGTIHSFNSNISTTLEKIPVIDATGIWSDNIEDRKAVAEEIRKASREIGFFYLVNHVCGAEKCNLYCLNDVWLTLRRVSRSRMHKIALNKRNDFSHFRMRRRWKCSLV